MNLDFYLSEFAASDRHGGGLTLLRVLGGDLERISLFAHLGLNANEYPAIGKLQARSLNFPEMWLRTPAARRWLGCRPSYWLRQQPVFNRWNARGVAARICARLPANQRPLRGLICPQHAHSLYVTEALRQRHSLAYITWVMDDHLVRWRDGKWIYPPHIEPLFARHLRHAKVVFVISQVMAEFYRDRFGVESRILFGPADPAETTLPPPPCADALRLGYFGAVAEWQMDALELIARNCAAVGATLDIYSGVAELPKALSHPSVRLMGRIPAMEVAATMRRYRAVVLPISFQPELRQMSELNIATKMSECLASGTVTLAVGPAYAAMIRLLQQHSAALCVTRQTYESVRAALTQLRDDHRWKGLAAAAQSAARRQTSSQALGKIWIRGMADLMDSK